MNNQLAVKKKILHMIGPIGIGGAELLLLDTINSLGEEFDNILVYLNYSEFQEIPVKNATILKLNFESKFSLPLVVLELNRIIKKFKVDIVHSHLLWPTFIARLACPKKVRFIFSVHSVLSEDAFKLNPVSRFLENLTYTSNQESIFVSEIARKDYNAFIGLKGKNYVLHNFISDDYFQVAKVNRSFEKSPVRMVAVGKLKEAKNYPYLLRAFEQLIDKDISLDIFGGGNLEPLLQNMITNKKLTNVKLRGPATNLPVLLKDYDIFVLASEYEGFGLAAIEAMASGLPCFLSNIAVFQEVTDGNAIFFDLKNEDDFVNKLLNALSKPAELHDLALAGLKRAETFNRETYIQELSAIYNNMGVK